MRNRLQAADSRLQTRDSRLNRILRDRNAKLPTRNSKRKRLQYRYGVSLSLLLYPLVAHTQATLPPAQPTRLTPQQAPPVQTAQPVQPSPQRPTPHHLQVLYSTGLLTIHAENASLNGILREISARTGMLTTGGVGEERVYGNYGPADTGTVLGALLSGTGSNMLLKESTADRPLTLVLTPRQGGPTPPSPASFQPEPDDDRTHEADLPPQQIRPTPAPGSIQPPQNQPAANTSAPSSTPATAATSADGTLPADTTTQQSPNGVKTPQQIYDQLMKLKQQQSTTPQ